jgi:transposase-like protein
MSTKNSYRKNSHFWTQKTREIMKFFAEDLTATQTSKLLWIERKSINNRYEYLRKVIIRDCTREEKEVLQWEIELDESYFGATRVSWKRWRWAGMKSIVFGLRKRNWKVYAEIIEDCSSTTLRKIIKWKVDKDSVLHTDWRRWYNWLVDVWYAKHYRVDHWRNEFVRGNQHVNWIESFWSFSKRKLSKFNGIKKDKFNLYLKECEFRFNCWIQWKNIYKQLTKICKLYVKNIC